LDIAVVGITGRRPGLQRGNELDRSGVEKIQTAAEIDAIDGTPDGDTTDIGGRDGEKVILEKREKDGRFLPTLYR